MDIGEAENDIKKVLKTIYEDREAANIADMVIEQITGWKRIDRIIRKKDMLSQEQQGQFDQYKKRLIQHEPVQYVLHKTWFHGMEFYVDKAVLIPRPETDELVDWIIQDVKATQPEVFSTRANEADMTSVLKILDVGTGSGCIALSLKKEMPKAEVWGCDISEEALVVARRNGSDLNIRADFQGMDFLNEGQQKLLPSVDIVVSNPPYIPFKDKNLMNRNVVDFEPHTALFVPDSDPLIFYDAIARFGIHRLHPKGLIYLEIHEDLGKKVIDLFSKAGYRDIELRKDMQGKERMIKITT